MYVWQLDENVAAFYISCDLLIASFPDAFSRSKTEKTYHDEHVESQRLDRTFQTGSIYPLRQILSLI
jgi:hypothetical protein